MSVFRLPLTSGYVGIRQVGNYQWWLVTLVQTRVDTDVEST